MVRHHGGTLVFALLLAGCGSGGGGAGSTGGDGSSQSFVGDLQLLSHSPADDALQVAVDAPIVLEFDGSVVPRCLEDPQTWLRPAAGGDPVEGSFEVIDAGRTVRFLADEPLQKETDYRFQLSPLTCDSAGRILERTRSFRFRSLDDRPPQVQSASVGDGATGVSRTDPFQITFDEPVDPDSVDGTSFYLVDTLGNRYGSERSVSGSTVRLHPHADLRGEQDLVLVVRGGSTGVTDRAGNVLATTWSVRFTTARDTLPPEVVAAWPEGGADMSPLLQPEIRFDESVTPLDSDGGAIRIEDEEGFALPIETSTSRDRKLVRLHPAAPLVAGQTYRVVIDGAPSPGIADLSGNAIVSEHTFSFHVGSDATAPAVTSAWPEDGATTVALTAQPEIRLSEPLEVARIDTDHVQLLDDGGPIDTVVAVTSGGSGIVVVPTYDLRPGTGYRLVLHGGPGGLRDTAGNPLPTWSRTFRTTSDDSLPVVLIQPRDGTATVPTNADVRLVFDSPVDPATVHSGSVVVSVGGSPISGSLSVGRGNRVVTWTPDGGWSAGEYTLTVVSGRNGVHEATGNALRRDSSSTFYVTNGDDLTAPEVTVTLNGTDASRRDDMVVPASGFTVEVEVFDPDRFTDDMGSADVVLDGPAGAPGPDAVFAAAEVTKCRLRWRVSAEHALPAGEYTVTAHVSDLAGNRGSSVAVPFRVVQPGVRTLPFERTQVVWVRDDLDRDGNGRDDFGDDLLRLGLMAEGDPAGTNAFMRRVVRDGVLTRANLLFGRTAGGSPQEDSVPLRMTTREPYGVAHMQMALGGFDPGGPAGRRYGDESTGVLGRALYDYRNDAFNERNTSTRPALGVFPAELFLFQARAHLRVYPSYVTSWARRFINLVPEMGGTPAGTHPEDPTVLRPGFDYGSATTSQRTRYDQVMYAADDWSTVIGIILAHEIGHSVGLVAPGPNRASGLHGDSSLHNEYSSVGDIMSSSVGYDAMISVDYDFRDLNLAYLRQRLVLD